MCVCECFGVVGYDTVDRASGFMVEAKVVGRDVARCVFINSRTSLSMDVVRTYVPGSDYI